MRIKEQKPTMKARIGMSNEVRIARGGRMYAMKQESGIRRAAQIGWRALLIASALGIGGCSPGSAAPPDVVAPWSPPEEIAAVTPLSCEEIPSLFAYDATAPLDTQEQNRRRAEGVTVIDLTYASPMGGRVPATLVIPDGEGPFAGLLMQHGMPSTRQPLVPGAETYARMGAVVALIDAPFNRPEHGRNTPLSFTKLDRREQIQLIVDLRRAVDLLLSRPEVDPQRLAYVGLSYGGAMGGLLAGVEHRLQGYVLQVGDGGLVSHFTGPEDTQLDSVSEEARAAWLAGMWPIEPIHYVRCAAPAKLLFQNGTLDQAVTPSTALRYQEAGSEPKLIRWYKAGHNLGAEAARDQAKWLRETIGLAGYRAYPKDVGIPIALWFSLTAISFIVLAVDMWRRRDAAPGAWLLWLLSVGFLGPLGLIIYFTSRRRPRAPGETDPTVPAWRRALGSAAWATAGNLVGGVVVLGLLIYYPSVVGRTVAIQIATTFVVPLSAGWAVFASARLISLANASYRQSYRRPVAAEMASTCLVLAGVYPVVNALITKYLSPWTVPFGFDLLYPPLWGALSLGAVAGTLLAYPFHLWMIRRGVVQWGEPPIPGVAKGLAWYVQAVLVALAIAVMLGAIVLSTQFA
jgi:uncharacterized protein